ncbi:MAG: hypothetical protein SF053_18595 [Bacteroidia bacterium]|nr:hypothetical protein [Bacteroidia bacterium]
MQTFFSNIVMGKKFTTKEKKLLGRASRRAQSLKTVKVARNVQRTAEIQNVAVIRSLEAKIKAATEQA